MGANLSIVSNENTTTMSVEQKEGYITEYIKTMASIESAMEPYKESKRDLKANYVENGWLTKEEISMAVKAYRLMKSDTDIEQLLDFLEHVKKTVGKND
jgi:hypothetical protein